MFAFHREAQERQDADGVRPSSGFVDARSSRLPDTGCSKSGDLGEPWLTFFTPSEISDHLMELGFSRVSHLTPEDAAARYFINRHDGLRPPHYARYVRATV